MIRRPPRSTRTDTLFPYTTLFRSMLVFAWRYRQSNKEATYDPEWSHSTQLELVIWSVPLLIIVALGALTRSEEHTSELQSLMRISYAVFCLKKKKKTIHSKSLL